MTHTPNAERFAVEMSLSVLTTLVCRGWDSNTQPPPLVQVITVNLSELTYETHLLNLVRVTFDLHFLNLDKSNLNNISNCSKKNIDMKLF